MKRILFVMTGGTIASVDNGAGLEPSNDNFFAPIVSAFNCEIEFINLFNLDSSQIVPSHWEQLAVLVDEKKDSFDGVVITHGTDTMAYTAAGLFFMLKNITIPVVLTGSQIPLASAHSDGRANVTLALGAALSGLAGVFVAFGGRVISGACCSKTYSENLVGFESINQPYMILNQTVLPPAKPYRLNLDYVQNVFLFKMAPGIEPDCLYILAKNGFRRILIEAYGKGGLPASFVPVIRALVEQGIRIGITTQCTYNGSDCYVYKVGRDLLEAGAMDYKQRTTEYAFVDMMFRK